MDVDAGKSLEMNDNSLKIGVVMTKDVNIDESSVMDDGNNTLELEMGVTIDVYVVESLLPTSALTELMENLIS